MEQNIYSKEFILKYIFRCLHLGPVIIVAGKIISDYFYPNLVPNTKSSNIVYALSGVVLILAGFINTFLLKTKEKLGTYNGRWKFLANFKFVLSILIYTPILKLMVDEKTKTAIQFYFLILFFFMSPYMRFYREYYAEYNKNKSTGTSKGR